jgi:hypothetical protein
MEEKILLAELTKNCGEKKKKLMDLLKAFDLAELGRKMDDEREKEISNRVLAENEFFCCKEYSRDTGFKIGERVTDEEFTFLLSESDFQKYLKLRRPLLVAAKLCDKEGYYLVNWGMITRDARYALVEYIIDEIVPKSIAGVFRKNIHSIVMQEKLIKITKEAFGLAA